MWPFKNKSQNNGGGLGKLVGYIAAKNLVAQYSCLKHRDSNLREKAEIRTDLTETEQQFRADKRILAYAQTNNLYDNSSIASTLDTAIRLTIGTKGGNCLFSGPMKDFHQSTFNAWKRHCGYNEGENLQEILELILRIVKLHGDCIILCDDQLTGGKIRIWDADQICNVSAFETWRTEAGLGDDVRQVEGVVIDGSGKVLGYFVTMRRNHQSVAQDDATFLPISICRRISYHKKHSQYRGEPAILANQELTEDTQSLLKSEIAAAKLASEMPLIVESPAGLDQNKISNLMEGIQSSDLIEGTGISDADISDLQQVCENDSKTFEAFNGKAAIANVAAGTKVTNLNNAARPSQPIQDWINVLNDINGKTVGVMSCLSRGRADNSYSSGQIEISISWAQFEQDQKMLERQVIDYVIDVICPRADYQVVWPKAFEIDPEKTVRVKEQMIRLGLLTYREELGPDYLTKWQQASKEREEAKQLGMDYLPLIATPQGAAAPQQEPHEETEP